MIVEIINYNTGHVMKSTSDVVFLNPNDRVIVNELEYNVVKQIYDSDKKLLEIYVKLI